MPETLLSEANIHLFGREVQGLTLDVTVLGNRGSIAKALSKLGDPRVARIYAFVFQNEYFDLVSPALFVVNGPGDDVDHTKVESTGLASTPPKLTKDLKVWSPERCDMTIRLDVSTGSFDRVLLEYELGEPGLQGFAPRGGNQLGQPAPLGVRRGRRPRWRSDEE